MINLKVITLIFVVVQCQMVAGQSLTMDWTFQTGNKVLASPVSDGQYIYVGSQNGIFYALDSQDGTVKWQYDTEGTVRAEALLTGDLVFFESANVFYALNTDTGKLKWKYDIGMEPLSFSYEGQTYQYMIDFWDEKFSVGVEVNGIIYVGCGNGTLYGLRSSDGTVVQQFSSDEQAPIRSTPFIDQGVIYFGDWEGVVYAYYLETGDLKWKKKTYRYERPYPSFGGVVSSFVRFNDLLIFGARNHIMNVLYLETGEKEWTYIDPKGGWIVGDPVLDKDTLYIGGSDNFSMYAFSPKWGRYLWQHNGGKNIYTRPIVTDNYVIYTAGNGYNWKDTGVVYVLDRKTGEELTKYETPGAVFSSPLLINNDQIVHGCHDGNVYSLKLSD